MSSPSPEAVNALLPEVTAQVIEALNLDMSPDEIDPDAPLFGEGLGLDSIDVLEISLLVSKRYGIQMTADHPDNAKIFASVRTLTAHIVSHRSQ